MAWDESLERADTRANTNTDITCKMGTLDYHSIDSGGRLGDKDLTSWAFSQLCNKLVVPCSYMRACPVELRDTNILYWRGVHTDKDLLVRQTVSNTRAVLSGRYGRLDDHRLLRLLHTKLQSQADVSLCRLNDDLTRIVLRDTQGPLKVASPEGDSFHIGMTFSNSEIGKAKFSGEFSLISHREGRATTFNGVSIAGVSRKHTGLTEEEFLKKVDELVSRLPSFRERCESKLFASFTGRPPTEDMEVVKKYLTEIFGSGWVSEYWTGIENDTSLTRWSLARRVAEEVNTVLSSNEEGTESVQTIERIVRGSRLAGAILDI